MPKRWEENALRKSIEIQPTAFSLSVLVGTNGVLRLLKLWAKKINPAAGAQSVAKYFDSEVLVEKRRFSLKVLHHIVKMVNRNHLTI